MNELPAPPDYGAIYFIGPKERFVGRVKIGFTGRHPAARIRDMQIGSPFELATYWFFKGYRRWEPIFHQLFAEQHLHGEWFRVQGALARLLEEADVLCDAERCVVDTDAGHMLYRVLVRQETDRDLADERVAFIETSMAAFR